MFDIPRSPWYQTDVWKSIFGLAGPIRPMSMCRPSKTASKRIHSVLVRQTQCQTLHKMLIRVFEFQPPECYVKYLLTFCEPCNIYKELLFMVWYAVCRLAMNRMHVPDAFSHITCIALHSLKPQFHCPVYAFEKKEDM